MANRLSKQSIYLFLQGNPDTMLLKARRFEVLAQENIIITPNLQLGFLSQSTRMACECLLPPFGLSFLYNMPLFLGMSELHCLQSRKVSKMTLDSLHWCQFSKSQLVLSSGYMTNNSQSIYYMSRGYTFSNSGKKVLRRKIYSTFGKQQCYKFKFPKVL